MEEATIQPNCIPQPSLSTAYDIGKQIEAKLKQNNRFENKTPKNSR